MRPGDTYRNFYFTVTSHEPRMRTISVRFSCASSIYNMDSKGVRATMTSKFRLDRAKGGALSESSMCLAKTMRQSYAIQRPCCPPVQFIECRVQSPVIKHTAGRVAFWPQPVGSLPLAQNAWHCTSYTYYVRTYVRPGNTYRIRVISISPSRVTSRACAQSILHRSCS